MDKKLKEKWNSLLRQIGELEDKEEGILGKEVAEEFFRTRKIPPNWDEKTRSKIAEIEKQIEHLEKEIETVKHKV